MPTKAAEIKRENIKNRVRELYHIFSNENEWKKFIEMSTRFSDYTFNEQLMIYAQNPEAHTCLTFNEWKELNFVPKRGSKSIMISRKTNTHVGWTPVHLFDVSSVTALQKEATLPKAHSFDNEIERKFVLETLLQEYGLKLENPFDEAAIRMIAYAEASKIIDEVEPRLNQHGIELNNDHVLFLSKSIQYHLGTTLGLNMSDVSLQAELNSFGEKGNYAFFTLSNTMTYHLKNIHQEIEKSIDNIDYMLYDKIEEIEQNLEEGAKTDERIELSPRRELSSAELSRARNEHYENGKMGIDEISILDGNGQQSSGIHDVRGDIGGTSSRSTSESREDGSSINERNEEISGIERRNESQWAMDEVRSNNHDDPGTSERNHSQRSDLQRLADLENNKTIVAKDFIQSAPVKRVKETKNVNLDRLIRYGTGFEDGKYRVLRLVEDSMPKAKKLKLLADEFGVGGMGSPTKTPYEIHGINTDSKGMELKWYNDNGENCIYNAKWNEVYDILETFIKENKYLTEKEAEHYYQTLANDENAFQCIHFRNEYQGLKAVQEKVIQNSLFDIPVGSTDKQNKNEAPEGNKEEKFVNSSELYEEFLPVFVDKIRQSSIYPTLRDRDTNDDEAEKLIRSEMIGIISSMNLEHRELYERYTGDEEFRKSIIDGIFDQTYNDISVLQTSEPLEAIRPTKVGNKEESKEENLLLYTTSSLPGSQADFSLLAEEIGVKAEILSQIPEIGTGYAGGEKEISNIIHDNILSKEDKIQAVKEAYAEGTIRQMYFVYTTDLVTHLSGNENGLSLQWHDEHSQEQKADISWEQVYDVLELSDALANNKEKEEDWKTLLTFTSIEEFDSKFRYYSLFDEDIKELANLYQQGFEQEKIRYLFKNYFWVDNPLSSLLGSTVEIDGTPFKIIEIREESYELVDTSLEYPVSRIESKTYIDKLLIEQFINNINEDEPLQAEKKDWKELLTSYYSIGELSSAIGYGFSDEDIKELAQLHKEGFEQEKIEDLLEDCNFHAEQQDFINKAYDKYIIIQDVPGGDKEENLSSTMPMEALKLGDTVEIDGSTFEITEIREDSIQLLEQGLMYPVYRVESKDYIEELLQEQRVEEKLEVFDTKFISNKVPVLDDWNIIKGMLREATVNKVKNRTISNMELEDIQTFFAQHNDIKERVTHLKEGFNSEFTGLLMGENTARHYYKKYENGIHFVTGTFSNPTAEAFFGWEDVVRAFEEIINERNVELTMEENPVAPGGNKEENEPENAIKGIPTQYIIRDNELGVGTPRERYANNVLAIQTLKKIEEENRYATSEEQEILAKYVGWGGLSEAFDESKWANEYHELKGLLNDEEYRAASRSTLTSFYTQPVVIRAMYQALENFGFEKGNLLEPAMGTGNFFGMIPENLQDKVKPYGVELDSISGRIAKQLYPNANIQITGFEKATTPDNFYDVAVGNVPFGEFKVNDKAYNHLNYVIHDYFFAKTIDKVRTGGIIAFISSRYTMDKENENVRKYLAERCDLIGAIRLPNTAFKGAAGTTVTSDIIFLQKRETPNPIVPEWVHTSHLHKEEFRNRNIDDLKSELRTWIYDSVSESYDDTKDERDTFINRINQYDITKGYGHNMKYDEERKNISFRNMLDVPTKWWKESYLNSETKQMKELDNGSYMVYLAKYSEYPKVKKAAEREIDLIIDQLYENIYIDKETPKMSSYFVEYPEMVLGNIEITSGRFGPEITCSEKAGSLEEQLQEAISHLHAEMPEMDVLVEETKKENVLPADMSIENYSFGILNDNVYYRENSIMRKIVDSADNIQNIKSQIILRNSIMNLLELQVNDYSDEEIRQEQAHLNQLYEAYVKKYGHLNKTKNAKLFSDDSKIALLSSLEVLDEDGNVVGKADVFTKRTIENNKAIDHVDSSIEALSVSIGEKAKVDLAYMSKLCGKNEEEMIQDLKGIIFYDPMENKWQNSDEYLSGNVREKLETIEMLIENHPEYQSNLEALKEVQPEWISAENISVQIGTSWIAPTYYLQFMQDVFKIANYKLKLSDYSYGQTIDVQYSEITNQWRITGKNSLYDDVTINQTFGTNRINALEILERSLNLKDVKIYDKVQTPDGKEKRVLNDKETVLATQKQEEMQEAFKSWVFENEERRMTLEETYNRRFNSYRSREYDGSHIILRGKANDITLRDHQKNAVARILYGGNSLLAHVVGAGKTFAMISACMESKRLGLCNKTMIVVPNHLVQQWGNDFMRLYPNANILVSTKKDFEKSNRKRFCSRIATGNYDAVILGQTQFERIPLSKERQEAMLQAEIDELMQGIGELKAMRGENFSIKQMEKQRKVLENRLEKLQNEEIKDDVVTFEQLGVDRLYVDEAHYYKNLYTPTKMTRVAGVQTTEAMRSSDLYNKITYLDEKTGGKGVVFATGTPVSNSMVELYTMQKYLQRNRLYRAGFRHFDMWAATFGEVVTALELKAEGTGYQTKQRFAKFNNLPELMTMFKEVADIQTSDMLNLDVPDVEYHDEVLLPSDEQKEFIFALSERADAVRNGNVSPEEDNMLKITNDGRKVALDQRLIDSEFGDNENSKVNALVQNIMKLYREYDDVKAAQLVFCDLSTPAQGETSVYHDIRNKLVEMGMPKEEIQFMQDHKKDNEKKALFSKVRAGVVRVLIGSTNTMGAGTNVQDRLIALHHVDVPWKPSDIEQQEGRILRQGNMFKELNKPVHIYRYITKGTFDAYSWQIIENKQKFISQIMTSKSPVRSAEDIDDSALSYAEVKALATGNPLIKEKMDLDIEVSKLKLLKSNHQSNIYKLQNNISTYIPSRLSMLKNILDKVNDDLNTLKKNVLGTHMEDGQEVNNFKIVLRGKTYEDKQEAGKMVGKEKETCSIFNIKENFGQYRSFELGFRKDEFDFTPKLVAVGKLEYNIPGAATGTGLLTNLEKIETIVEVQKTSLEQKVEETLQQFDKAKEEVKKTFEKEQELKDKMARLNELNALLSKPQEEVDNTDKEEVEKESNDVVEETPSKNCEDVKQNSMLAHIKGLGTKTEKSVDDKEKTKEQEL
ncbi:MAG: SNF2-related protein [Clostridium sp.]|nr:SNF2-related protein [Clostridium sp.]MDU2155957.1 SNF2-related protein [Clostridium sp.]